MTRDANKQSVRCEYSHRWIKATETTINNEVVIRCRKCGAFPKAKETKQAEAIVHLQSVLKPGDTIYTVLRHVSRSGMSRNIDLYYMQDGKPQWISAYVGHAIGSPQSRKNWERSQGLTVGGCGMDMGFALVYDLSRTLFPDGFKLAKDQYGRNGDKSGYDRDGGYALRHQWL
jgi:hypothetical protein